MNPQASMPSSPPSVTTGGLGSIGPGAGPRGMQATAQQLQGYGRGEDTMLVHMTPGEVNSLQGLAMAAGGSLTINPDTGLPEASFIKKLLPFLLGIGLNFIIPGAGLAIGKALGGIGAAAGTGVAVGAGTAAITGDLKQGLMAGLGAFGGASLAGGIQGALGTAAKSATGNIASSGVSEGLKAAATTPLTSGVTAIPQLAQAAVPGAVVPGVAAVANTAAAPLLAPGAYTGAFPGVTAAKGASTAALRAADSYLPQAFETSSLASTLPPVPSLAPVTLPPIGAKTGLPGFMQGFGDTARGGMGGFAGKAAPYVAGMGVINALQPTPAEYKPEKEEPGSSQYTSAPRQQLAPRPQLMAGAEFDPTNFDSSEQRFFTPSRPDIIGPDGQVFIPGTNPSGMAANPNQFASLRRDSNGYSGSGLSSSIFNDPRMFRGAEGGRVPEFEMQSGGHVFPAKAVAAYGDFDTDAGQRKLAGLGAIPIRGPGTGVSDSIPANIDGRAPARVASGEVYFPPKAVKRLGGNEKLYAMMKQAERAASRTKSGEKVRGLA